MTKDDIHFIIDYFYQADAAFLNSMGVDINKLPPRNEWQQILLNELELPADQKKIFYVIWEIGGTPVGHSHINHIIFGEEANMHLHLWQHNGRQKGNGSYFVKASVPVYFETFKLKKLFCQPYALNEAPNKTLAKAGFEFVKEYETVPGASNFVQPVKLWVYQK